jgi:two-component system, chemotaxis family, chemotaxis protein CheY
MKSFDAVRVLVIEDEPFMRATIKQMLRMLGNPDIREAGDGQTALETIASFHPQVVLCDIGMKPMSGLQFVEKLRGQGDAEMRATPVVMLTGDGAQSTVAEAAKLGISGYLVKPISPKNLADRLRIALTPRKSA